MSTFRKLWKNRKKLLIILDVWPEIVAFLLALKGAYGDRKITSDEVFALIGEAIPLVEKVKDAIDE